MSTRLIQLVALIVAIVGVLTAFLLTPTINRQRVDRQLTYDVEVGDGANPSYALAASLGSFRGVLISVLWQRSEALKQEGKFFESNNLAQYITTLQPRFADAWDIQAWNMAYNISVKTKTKEERWDWVNKGMTLLRDRGIPNNPNAVVLYRSIAWILGHKMAGQTDDMHYYYKARMANTWQTVLGAPDRGWDWKPQFREPENRPLEEDFDRLIHGEWLATQQFEKIANMAKTYLQKVGRTENDYRPSNYFTTLSPSNRKKFYDQQPGLQAVVEELQALQGPDGQDLQLGLNTRTLRAFGRLQMYLDAGYDPQSPAIHNPEVLGLDAMAIYDWIIQTGEQSDRLLNLNRRNDIPAIRQKNPEVNIVDLVPMFNLLRALALIDEYHMDPAFMLHCMERFGPIDWRHPAAHALYWSALGTRRAEAWVSNKDRVDLINANRNIIHNLQKLAHAGKINYRPQVATMGQTGQETIDHAPDVRMIPAYDRAWQDTIDKLKAGDFGDKHKDAKTYANGHENFLQAAVYLYYYDGQTTLARDYFRRVKELYNKKDNTISPAYEEGHYELNLPDFARVRFDDDLGFQAVQLINTRIKMAWRFGLAERSRAVIQRHLSDAKKTYDDFLAERQTTARGDLDVQARQDLLPFEDYVMIQFIEMMASTEYSLPQKAGIWQLAAPLLAGISDKRPLLFEVYGRMIPFLTGQADLEGRSADLRAAFPEPPGYQAWYQQTIEQQPALPGLPQPSQSQ